MWRSSHKKDILKIAALFSKSQTVQAMPWYRHIQHNYDMEALLGP